ncbi:MAG: transcription-repair coupling factor [Actinobacteria bacterium]|nr:transcription-repair coupling factor [Actinomycetota bacterium]
MTSRRAPLAGLATHVRSKLDGDLLAPGALYVGPTLRPLTCALLTERATPLLAVTPTARDADALVDGLGAFVGPERVALFPAWETLPHERLSPQPATVGARLRALDRVADHEVDVLVTPVRALLQPMDPRLGERRPVRVAPSYDGGLEQLVRELSALGYVRTTLVEQRGEFAVRGGIVDIFASTQDHAVRVEFWGDDVDQLRWFGVADQRALDTVDAVDVYAARELVLDEETAATARALASRVPALADRLGMLVDGIVFEGAESLVTALQPSPAWLPELLPADAGVVLVDPARLEARSAELREQAEVLAVAGWSDADSDVLGTDGVGFGEYKQVTDRVSGPVWSLDPFGSPDIPGRPWESFRGDIAAAARRVGELARDGVQVVLSAAGHGSAVRLGEVLREQGVAATVVETVGSERITIVESALRDGFVAPELGVALLGEWDLFGPRRSRASRRLPSRRTAQATVLDLSPGDPIVHAVHGVGIYQGITTRQLRGPTSAVGGQAAGQLTRDYVIVEYVGGDRLFVPSDNVDALAPYIGGEEPRVMRMGGVDWERAKGRVRRAVREMAGELLRLYQARMHAPGTAFAPDTPWQSELEQAFAHVETPDQVSAIDEVKQDMETPVPMDRLICGDVGFGKTEIAVRAAAKAVFDGRQVAVLVPTTLLAQQHGETFAERFAGFPVRVETLSRFAGPARQREILDGLSAGTVDLVIGTHRLLSQDVVFKDLGLVVVDEEQRFGVGHKEKLKQLRTSVDVLTMTATPIPRTMEMAITGIRDLSTIDTPPEERQPIVTHVGPSDPSMAALAIRRELLREGQVFWLHNQVSTISAAAQAVRELVPDARIEIAHGQMAESQLERIMIRFWEREFDVLVCTTIIENGLDIPNANTLLVERADLFGLAQLYQLRGRVGRSTVRGYAYLFHPEHRTMTEEAYKRLETVATHTGLGSGMSIALRDLEIRGAGNVLSADQSGHIATVGFEAYAQLMREEMAELRDPAAAARERAEAAEISIDLPVDAHLPSDYIADEGLRLQAYRRIAGIRDGASGRDVTDELTDRYGTLPASAARLITIAALRAAARRWGITEISVTPRRTVRVLPVHLSESQQVRLRRERPRALWNEAAGALELPMPSRDVDLVGWTARELKAVLGKRRR